MKRHLLHLSLLLAVAYALFFHHLGKRDLWSSHEARAAQDATSVLKDGQWLLPRLFDGRLELQKPPLYYWLAALFSWPGGEVTETTVRMPGAFAALLTLLALYAALAYLGQAEIGLLAALILATCVRFSWLGRVGRIDMPLTATVTISLLGFFLAWREFGIGRRGRGDLFAFVGYLAIAAGLMLKGPIGAVLPALVGSSLCALCLRHLCGRLRRAPSEDNHREHRDTKGTEKRLARTLLWGLPLVAALTLPWAVAANAASDGRFFDEFIWKHNLQRGLGGDEQLDGHEHPFWFYASQIWLDALPWSLAIPALAALALRRTDRRGAESAEENADGRRIGLFALAWFLSMFIFLSFMRYKRPDYLLPAFPGLALALAAGLLPWIRAQSEVRQTWLRRGLAVGLALFLAGWLGFVDLYLPRHEPARSLAAFAKAVRERAAGDPVLLFRVDVHQLAWHLGKPAERLWEWENLDVWAAGERPLYVVTTPEWAGQWEQHLEAGRLRCVTTIDDALGVKHELPLILMVTEPAPAAERLAVR